MTNNIETSIASLAQEVEGIEDEIARRLALEALKASKEAIERGESNEAKYVETQLNKKLTSIMKGNK